MLVFSPLHFRNHFSSSNLTYACLFLVLLCVFLVLRLLLSVTGAVAALSSFVLFVLISLVADLVVVE